MLANVLGSCEIPILCLLIIYQQIKSKFLLFHLYTNIFRLSANRKIIINIF